MVRILERNDSFVEGSYSGCMAGLLNILDYHHWHNVRKLLPHKRHCGRRRRALDRSPRINARNFGEEYIDTDAQPLLVKQHNTEEAVRTSKRSGKTRSKLRSEEHHRSWILSFHLNSWLHRTNPVHHLEPSENCWDHIDTNAKIPVIVSQKSKAINATKKSKHGQIAMSKDSSDQQLGECVDVLEIFKVNKEFFLKILQDPKACTSHFHGLKNSNIKVRLAKSRSFPVASSLPARYVRPSTLKHKQNEVWFFLNGEKSIPGTQAGKLEELETKSIRRGDDGTQGIGKQTSVSSLRSSKGLNSQGWNQIVISRFRDIKHKIKQALKESKRENNSPRSVEEAPQRDTFGGLNLTDGTEMCERLEITIDRESNEINGSGDDLRKRSLHRISRTTSLSESIDRYTQLFENNFGRDNKKYSHSRSLRVLTSEEKLPSQARKSYRRNLSLPDLDSLASFLNVAASQDALRLGMSFNIPVDHSTTKNRDYHNVEPQSFRLSVDTDNSELLERIDSHVDIECSADLLVAEKEKGMTWTDNIPVDSSEPVRELNACLEEDICLTKYLGDELSQENYETDFESCFSDGLSSPAVFPKTEGLEVNVKCTQTNELISCTLRQDWNTNLFTENEDFNYVRHVLELSSFVGDDEAPTWHSIDQPLSPSLFKKLEDCFDSYENEITGSYNDQHHQLLFDLINETLVDMNEKSHMYFPRTSSRSMPKGNRLLADVWMTTDSYLSLRPEMDSSLDDVVARDLAKRDGRINLEWDREMVALELEDMIFNQLLEDVLCS